MVKTLLSVSVLFLAMFAYTQNVRISWEDDYSMPYNGEEVTINGSGSTIYTNFYVVNESNESTFVWRRDLLSVSSQGFDDQLCDDQICYTTSGNPWICPGPLTIAENDSSLFQPKLLTNGLGGTAHMRYYVLDENENKLDSIDVVFSSTASVNTTNISSIKIFPNPAKNTLTLENLTSSDDEILVFDALGKNVLRSTISNTKEKIFLKDLKNGVYFVRIKNTNGSISKPKKLVVRK